MSRSDKSPHRIRIMPERWTLNRISHLRKAFAYFWRSGFASRTTPRRMGLSVGLIYLEPEDDQKTGRMMIGGRIGRRLIPSKTWPERVYQLGSLDPPRSRSRHAEVTARLQVTLPRIVPENRAAPSATTAHDQMPAAGYLQIAAVQGAYGGEPVTPGDLQLRFCPIDSDDYWMGACIFHGEWPERRVQQ